MESRASSAVRRRIIVPVAWFLLLAAFVPARAQEFDIAVLSLEVDGSCDAGFTDVVARISCISGTYHGTGDLYVDIYLSQEPVPASGNPRLRAAVFHTDWPTGVVYRCLFDPIDTPPGVCYYPYLICSVAIDQDDPNRENNWAACENPMPAGPPDNEISDLTIIGSCAAGFDAVIADIACVEGAYPDEDINACLYLSHDTQLDAGDVALRCATFSGGWPTLCVFQCHFFGVAIPENACDYAYVLCRIAPGGTRADNDMVAVENPLEPPPFDNAITYAGIGGSCDAGLEGFGVFVVFKDGLFWGDTTVCLYLSEDDVYDPGDVEVACQSFPRMFPAEPMDIYTIPSIALPANACRYSYVIVRILEGGTNPDNDVYVLENPGGGIVIPEFFRADANQDGQVDIADAVFILAYLFNKGAAPQCEDSTDVNDDGMIDISDAICALSHLFGGVTTLLPPFGECGEDPTDDTLECASFSPCGV